MDRIVLDFDDQHKLTGGDVAIVDVGVYVHRFVSVSRSLNPQYQASQMISEIIIRSKNDTFLMVSSCLSLS